MQRADLGLMLERRIFLPEARVQEACAIEKDCVKGVGERLLLHFAAAVRNVGDADLLFGSSNAAPFSQAACDGQPYFAKYLTYSLVDSDGGIQVSGQRQARCEAKSTVESGFDCQFNGLEHGSAQMYPSRPMAVVENNAFRGSQGSFNEGVVPGPDDVCQWLDVTDVAPGNYFLRLQVNAEGLLAEARLDNNRIEIPISLPTLDDPTQACPMNDDTWLLGYAESRECGWVASGPTAACTPGASVMVGCSVCTGSPLLRVSEGSLACPFAGLLAYNGAGEFSSDCPQLEFSCPPSGSYTVYRAPSGASSAAVTCTLQANP